MCRYVVYKWIPGKSRVAVGVVDAANRKNAEVLARRNWWEYSISERVDFDGGIMVLVPLSRALSDWWRILELHRQRRLTPLPPLRDRHSRVIRQLLAALPPATPRI